MKIYQIHRYGGEWEDSYDYIISSYLSEEKAKTEMEQLEKEEKELQELRDRCQNCPLLRFNKEDININEYCDRFEWGYDEDYEEDCCLNEYWTHYDSYYKLEEVEVIE